MIFRWVAMRHGNPSSMREIVMGETPAVRASSVLLINRASLTFFKAFFCINGFFYRSLEKH
jgi:hypothetical protein